MNEGYIRRSSLRIITYKFALTGEAAIFIEGDFLPRISYPWLSYPSTRSRCHTECEIKALITLLVNDDVLLK